MADYKTIRGVSTYEYEEKRSRFIATAAFADTEEKAVAHLNRVRAANRTARHNVYAYVLREGGRTRYSDDGEPAKTAGTPVLEAIGHAGLSDVIVVVTRYFGGILLGTGGLVRAYTAAASGALQNAELVTMRLVTDCSVTVSYPQFEQAQRIIAAQQIDAGVAHGREQKGFVVDDLFLPKPYKAILHHVFGTVGVATQIVHGIKAQRPIEF